MCAHTNVERNLQEISIDRLTNVQVREITVRVGDEIRFDENPIIMAKTIRHNNHNVEIYYVQAFVNGVDVMLPISRLFRLPAFCSNDALDIAAINPLMNSLIYCSNAAEMLKVLIAYKRVIVDRFYVYDTPSGRPSTTPIFKPLHMALKKCPK